MYLEKASLILSTKNVSRVSLSWSMIIELIVTELFVYVATRC